MIVYAVVRKCCLGPNCDYNHGAPRYDPETNSYPDRRLLVIQYATPYLPEAERVARNWAAYEAVVEPVTEGLYAKVRPSSAEWLCQKVARLEVAAR
jgi:hypothetical protein